MSGHTPGPWEAKHSRKVTVEGPCRPVFSPEGFPVAFVPAWDAAAEEAEANARLIAAAPELLLLVKDIEESLTADGTYRLLREACRAAIAKAKGAAQ